MGDWMKLARNLANSSAPYGSPLWLLAALLGAYDEKQQTMNTLQTAHDNTVKAAKPSQKALRKLTKENKQLQKALDQCQARYRELSDRFAAYKASDTGE